LKKVLAEDAGLDVFIQTSEEVIRHGGIEYSVDLLNGVL